MTEREKYLRNLICEIGRKLYNNGYVVASDGNISAKLSSTHLLITPSGKCKGELKESDIVKMDMNGQISVGSALKPSSEYRLHLFSYLKNKDIECIIHAHPPFSTTCAVSGISMENFILPEVVITAGKVPLISYENPGSIELAESVSEHLVKYSAVLMANHGLVVAGKELLQTYYNLERVEFAFKVLYYSTLLGKVNTIEVDKVKKLFADLEIPESLKDIIRG